MHRSDKSGLVGIIVDGDQLYRLLFRSQHHRRAAGDELAEAACLHAAADRYPFDPAPFRLLLKAPYDRRQFPREILDGGMQEAGRLRIARCQQPVELAFCQFVRRLVADRVVAVAPQGFSQPIDDLAKCPFARPVPDESFLVLQFAVVAGDKHRRQPLCAVTSKRRLGRSLGRFLRQLTGSLAPPTPRWSGEMEDVSQSSLLRGVWASNCLPAFMVVGGEVGVRCWELAARLAVIGLHRKPGLSLNPEVLRRVPCRLTGYGSLLPAIACCRRTLSEPGGGLRDV